MKIVKIKKLSNSKYKVKLDNEDFITFDNVILKNGLLYKKEISSKELLELKKETLYYEVYNKTLKYCTNKIRSKNEVLKYINKYNINNVDKICIIKKLEELNFINDIKFTKAFINDKIHLSKYGINKIKILLKENKIDENIINEELNKVNFSEVNLNLENKIKKKINNNSKYSNYELKQKLLNEYIKDGYMKNDIILFIDKYLKDDYEILVKEFEKLYNKYKVKYETNVLKIKIKQKLIQRGFNIEYINELINKKQGNN